MTEVTLAGETDWDGWRAAARALVLAGHEPATVDWTVGAVPSVLPSAPSPLNLPRQLVLLAAQAIQARSADRFGLLYSLVWRAARGEKVLEQGDDADLRAARRLALSVRADAHRMRSHLRFMPVGGRLLGWYTPAHFVLEANAQLFARRFPATPFSIVTPDGAAHYGDRVLRFGEGLRAVDDDATLRAWWDAYGEALLNAARPGTSIPEAEDLDEDPRPPDRPPLGPVVLNAAGDGDLSRAGREARGCQRCDLHGPATQTVFGEGPTNAQVMFVGEQPGDREDVIGRPFVGPAGQLLDRALEEAGIDRRAIYITNAVKHFKFTPRGKRRIHQSPDTTEIRACGFWLDVERVEVQPRLTVLMGGSAARAVLGRAVSVGQVRGRPFRLDDGQMVFVTVHPSYLLRIPEEARKAQEYQAFQRDLVAIRDLAGGL